MQVLGNRDMRLKYLNRNTIFAVSGTQQDGIHTMESLLTAQLIDTVTGQVLYSQSLQVVLTHTDFGWRQANAFSDSMLSLSMTRA